MRKFGLSDASSYRQVLAKYATDIVVAHLLVNIGHSLARRELQVGLAPLASISVIVVVLFSPLVAMALVRTAEKRLGLILLSLSMVGSLLFGFYHHFSGCQPRSCPFAASGCMGDHACLDRVLVAYYGSDWNFRLRRTVPSTVGASSQ